jgi:hypothetical protein
LSRLGLHPSSLVSPISAFDKEYFSKLDLPQFEDIPEEASEYAYNCCHGPWIESFAKGAYTKVYDWDLVSAYPFQLTKCIDTRKGTWLKSDKWDDSAYYGYCKGIVNITADFSPIIYSKTNEMSYTPKGEWETFLNKKEIEFIRKYNIGDFELESAWYFYPTEIVYPLKKMMDWLYAKKESSTGMTRKIVKRIMSGCWGRTLQVDFGEVAGEFFNSVWGNEVEVGTRLEVAKFILDNDLVDHVLNIAVDGVLTAKEVKL